MNYKFSILTILITCNFIACDIPEYEAKYRFESEEISITGIRPVSYTHLRAHETG